MIPDNRNQKMTAKTFLGKMALLISLSSFEKDTLDVFEPVAYTRVKTSDQEVVDMMQNQHQRDMETSDATALAEASEEPTPQGTRFKVVSPKDKISPQQVN